MIGQQLFRKLGFSSFFWKKTDRNEEEIGEQPLSRLKTDFKRGKVTELNAHRTK